MKKSEIFETYSNKTGISYKHQDLFVGDVYKGKMGVLGMVIAKKLDDGSTKYYFKKTNNCEHALPEERAGMNDGIFIANVIQDDELMKTFIDAGIIIDDDNDVKKENKTMAKNETSKAEQPKETVAPPPPVAETKEEKPKKTTKKAEQPKETVASQKNETKTKNIYEKINAVRMAWSMQDVEKEGRGRAGGGAKYDYYKPQQIIDFCLKQELENRLYSKFSVNAGECYYAVQNLDNLDEIEMVCCPFDVPRKMAASEAQQIGAAMTYYNRRLAMMMYKIEDNSRESVQVLEDADYSAIEIPAPPVVPAPPIINTETQLPPPPPTNIQAEVISKPIDEPKSQNDKVVPPPSENAKSDNVAAEIKQNEEVVPPPPTVQKETKEVVPPPPPAPQASVTPPPPPAVTKPAEQPKAAEQKKTTGSIADLY